MCEIERQELHERPMENQRRSKRTPANRWKLQYSYREGSLPDAAPSKTRLLYAWYSTRYNRDVSCAVCVGCNANVAVGCTSTAVKSRCDTCDSTTPSTRITLTSLVRMTCTTEASSAAIKDSPMWLVSSTLHSLAALLIWASEGTTPAPCCPRCPVIRLRAKRITRFVVRAASDVDSAGGETVDARWRCIATRWVSSGAFLSRVARVLTACWLHSRNSGP